MGGEAVRQTSFLWSRYTCTRCLGCCSCLPVLLSSVPAAADPSDDHQNLVEWRARSRHHQHWHHCSEEHTNDTLSTYYSIILCLSFYFGFTKSAICILFLFVKLDDLYNLQNILCSQEMSIKIKIGRFFITN